MTNEYQLRSSNPYGVYLNTYDMEMECNSTKEAVSAFIEHIKEHWNESWYDESSKAEFLKVLNKLESGKYEVIDDDDSGYIFSEWEEKCIVIYVEL